MLSIKQAVDAYAATSDRTWSEDRSQTVGASEVGQCARKTWFSKFEDDPVEQIVRDAGAIDRWGARVRGTVYENRWWAPALKARYGEHLLYAGEDQRTFFHDYVSATPDGLVIDQPADALAHLGVPDIEGSSVAVECKTADPRTRLDKPKPEHRFQVIVQLGLIRTRTNHKPMWGLLSYTDTSFWDEVIEFPIRFDETVFAQALQRARQIMTARSAFDLKPEGKIAGGKECEYCPFVGLCGAANARAAERLVDTAAIDPGAAALLVEKARVARDREAEAERLAAEARSIKEEIKTDLARLGVKTLKHDGVSIVWSSVKGRPAWDQKALREASEAAGIDTSRFTTVGDATDRLSIALQ